MWPLLVTLVFGLLVIVPCWKAFISALLLEKDPDKWEKWQQQECARRQRRDERIAQCWGVFLLAAGWLVRRLRKRAETEIPPGRLKANAGASDVRSIS
jgi:hypothetical protein